MRPFSSTMTSLATVRYMIFTLPVRSASFTVTVGSYFACIGQIGMQLVLPAHVRRCRNGRELRAAGVLLTFKGMPSMAKPAILLLMVLSTFDSGIFGMG